MLEVLPKVLQGRFGKAAAEEERKGRMPRISEKESEELQPYGSKRLSHVKEKQMSP